ncbi:MAG: hypothetical protein OMM_15025, partial [Candidatus Magnetoglobus multicellularis str. Araruama]
MTFKKRIIIITISFLCASFVWANPFDINQDNKTGLPEAIHALKVSAGISDDIQCNQYSLNAVDGDPQNAVYVDSVGRAIFSNKVVIKTYIVTLTDTETDLGEQLQSLLDKYQLVRSIFTRKYDMELGYKCDYSSRSFFTNFLADLE